MPLVNFAIFTPSSLQKKTPAPGKQVRDRLISRHLPLLIPVFYLAFHSLRASAQTDDFNDGDDQGWTRIDSIGSYIGVPHAQHTVTNGRYRLTSPPSPAPALIGNARSGSYRADTVMSDFVAVVDVAAWDNSLNQAFGLLARIRSNPGLGAVFAYAMSYQPVEQELEINLITGEQPINLARVAVTLSVNQAYRFVFTGQENRLSAAIYHLEAPLLPVTTLSVTNDTYAAGHCGLYGLDSTNAAGTVDVTFDNYTAGPWVAPSLTFQSTTSQFTAVWPRRTGAWHLQSSPTLSNWQPIRSGGTAIGDSLTFSAPFQPKIFYRLAEGW